jgi:uncharacterized protein
MTLLTRRRVLVGTGAVGALAAVDAFGVEPNWLDVSRHDVPVPGLPSALDGFRIAQVTDAHLHGLGAVEHAIVRRVAEDDVRLVVLTGDIVNDTRAFPHLKELCRALAARGRTLLATYGNWEHWGNIAPDVLSKAYAAVGATLVVNDAFVVDSALSVVATDDSLSGRARLSEPLAKRANTPASLFLTHCPEFFDRVPKDVRRFDLSLAGHTHGGQVRAGSFAPVVPPGSGRFVSGWYETPAGRAYVSRGTGTSLVPVRFSCRPELPIFTLRRG